VGVYSYTGGTNVILSGTPTINNLLSGGSTAMTLSSGVTVNGNLILESNLDLNGKTITLGSSGNLIEGSGLLSGSSGSITTIRSLSNIAENVAGLGAELTTSANLGSTEIIRSHAPAGDRAIERKYYINPTTNTGLNATLVFHYDDSELNGLTESTLALFKSENGSTWTEQSSTLDADNNTLTLSGIGSFSYWTAGPTGSDQSLPVELTDFAAVSQSGGVALTWRTESETENLGFIIERRNVGAIHESPSYWSQIASYVTSKSLAGHGSTSAKHDYQYIDKAIQPGATYLYRLADVDYSGKVTWHQEVEVKVEGEGDPIPLVFGLKAAYPNPFNPSATLNYALTNDGQVSLKVYNVLGQLVETLMSTYVLKGTYSLNWQPQNLSTGIYFIRLQSGNKTNLQKVVFVK